MATYTIASPAAIAGGAAAACGAIALLVRDGFTTGWTVDLALMPLLVGVTILAGHHVGKALRRGKIIAATGLMLLAIFGSGLTVYETAGRRAEVRDAKTASAADSVATRQHLAKMLAQAEANVILYRQRMSEECTSGKGKRCEGATYTVETWEAAVRGYRTDIANLGSPKPVDPRGERVAALAVMFGVGARPDVVQRTVALVEPLAFPLFLELGSIVLFGYGLGRGRRREDAKPGERPAAAAITFEEPLTPAEIEELRRLLIGAGRPLNNGEIAKALSISQGESSKRVAEAVALGLVSKQRVGREVAVTVH